MQGIRVYDKSGKVIFTTGKFIENPRWRNGSEGDELVAFVLNAGERIIGIRSHDWVCLAQERVVRDRTIRVIIRGH